VRWPSELAIVLALAARPSGGYRVHVDRVTEQDGTLTVLARENPPCRHGVRHLRVDPAVHRHSYSACPGTVEHHITVTESG
jgi:hypothetical protein